MEKSRLSELFRIEHLVRAAKDLRVPSSLARTVETGVRRTRCPYDGDRERGLSASEEAMRDDTRGKARSTLGE